MQAAKAFSVTTGEAGAACVVAVICLRLVSREAAGARRSPTEVTLAGAPLFSPILLVIRCQLQFSA